MLNQWMHIDIIITISPHITSVITHAAAGTHPNAIFPFKGISFGLHVSGKYLQVKHPEDAGES